MTRLQPIHPGEVLKHDFMDPFGLSATALAKAIGLTPACINEIVHGRRGITATTASRLAKYYGTDAQSWMNLQTRYELALGVCAAGRLRRAMGRPPTTCITCRDKAAGGRGGTDFRWLANGKRHSVLTSRQRPRFASICRRCEPHSPPPTPP